MTKLNNNAKWGRNPDSRKTMVTELVEKYGTLLNRKQVIEFIADTKRTVNDVSWLLNGTQFRAGRGQYTLAPLLDQAVSISTSTEAPRTGLVADSIGSPAIG
ncbi:hypothetical protein UFOVP410_143 [uncultured Caudovirales phage]|uniref:Uncharacterized protein n=1 Tax=uncultured Caudovirales phage TaxID=2100421 RepID=A0A6J5M3F6_9CAUD|nr:hypothetical protein UFOVP410_143 [uncultured Caudovirales phage]